MEYLRVDGGKSLFGETEVHGAKNSTLPILAACVLIEGECVIHNVPELSDVDNTIKILRGLGAEVSREGKTLTVDSSSINKYEIPRTLMREMRSSIIFLGALSSRMKKACLYLPGGCEIGLRPVDLHLKGLERLGYKISFDGENICSSYEKRKNSEIPLSFPSVGATENLILACVLMSGKTRIVNAAREPEITDLCDFLISAGAKIYGAGTSVIEIDGVKKLRSCEHTVIPDRILVSTLMSAAAITGGDIKLKNVTLSHLVPVLDAFTEAGCRIFAGDKSLILKAPKRLRRVKSIKTGPYPGFPTDSQSLFCAMLSKASGVSVIYEAVFENRFKHINELIKFGADISVHDRTAVINGVKTLHPAKAYCTDLRGGAAVVIAALSALGISYIYDISHIDRGYENFENQLSSLGACVTRIKDEKER